MTIEATSATVRSSLRYCGLVAGPLFVLAFLIEGATRGHGYSPLRHPVSSLELGDHGWTQTANFLVAGALTIAFAVGLWQVRRVGAALVGLWGVGLLGAGVFTTDPVSGYPIGTASTVEYTTAGGLHNAFSLLGFLALAVAQVLFTRGQGRGWALYSVLSAAAFVVCFLLAVSGFSQAEALVGVAGLFQRLALVVGWGWMVALAWRAGQMVLTGVV